MKNNLILSNNGWYSNTWMKLVISASIRNTLMESNEGIQRSAKIKIFAGSFYI